MQCVCTWGKGPLGSVCNVCTWGKGPLGSVCNVCVHGVRVP